MLVLQCDTVLMTFVDLLPSQILLSLPHLDIKVLLIILTIIIYYINHLTNS